MTELLDQLCTQISGVACKDRFRFERALSRLRTLAGQKKPVEQDIDKLAGQVAVSADWVANRISRVPPIKYPDLPVSAAVEEIKRALTDNQVLVVAGETGSGKTTQIPKICLQMGLAAKGLIGHTQPRRVAARAVGHRIAEELGSALGALVGYQVRFTDKSGPTTQIKLMTDGILLSEIQRDPYLNKYQCIIIDEAHERSLNIDFLLGYLKRLLPKRPDLKLIITSATIDVERFSKHFYNAPVIEVSGRTFPVEVFYQPWEEGFDSPIEALVAQVANIIETEPTASQAMDILVFLAGERDIREAALALRRAQLRNLDILPLYSRLSVSDQDKIFKPGRGRRVVLATNVAETSLTVPGIGYVIDTGTARISRYSVRTKVQRLPIEAISQASANQRAGRCGRIAEGVCVRLYAEEDFKGRPEFTAPEILRTNLASVILQMQYLKLGHIADFPFVEPPAEKQIRDGFRLLEELSLVDEQGGISKTGKLVSGLPVDPRFARILWQAQQDNCLNEIITVVSCLSLQDPRERPADKQQKADERHRAFMDADSDFNTILTIWNSYQEQRKELSNRQLDTWCRDNFLSVNRMREWREIHLQLTLLAKERNWKINSSQASYKVMHRALLSGLLTQVGIQGENKEFLGTRNRNFRVFPGSNLARKPPKWLVAAQMLDTSQLFAHQVAKIDPDWLLGIADHLLQRDYYEPHYHSGRGEIMARMRYSLYGLVISDQHKLSYKSIDPKLCRELFIREALCYWKYRSKAAFYRHNRSLCERLQNLEDRTRSRDLAVDEQQLYEFYESKIPETIVDLVSFDQWRQEQEVEQPNILFLDEAQLMSAVDSEKLVEFPDHVQYQGLNFSLSYKFEPGSDADGVTMHIPVDALHQVPDDLTQWLVPGLLKEKLVVMLKGLPKAYRRNLVPIPTKVDQIFPRLQSGNSSLAAAVANELKRATGKDIPVDAWADFQFDDFYRMRFSLEDTKGAVLDSSRSLVELRETYRARASEAVAEVTSNTPEFADSVEWSFGELPDSLDIKKGKNLVRLWPGLVDKEASVGYQLFNDPYEAHFRHRRGIERMLLLQMSQSVKYLDKELFKKADLTLMCFDQVSVSALRADILLSVARDLIATGLPSGGTQIGGTQIDGQPATEIRSAEAMAACVEQCRGELVKMALQRESLCLKWAQQLGDIRAQIAGLNDAFSASVTDIQSQINSLFAPDFFYAIPADWLKHIERFLRAILQRIVRMQGQLNRDIETISEIRLYEEQFQRLLTGIPENRRSESSELLELRWLLEEYRISLFSQPIKTSRPISAKRLTSMIGNVEESTKNWSRF